MLLDIKAISMSLINKILKELDQNGPKSNNDLRSVNVNIGTSSKKYNPNLRNVIILGVLVIVFAIVLVISYIPAKSHKLKTTQKSELPKTPTKPSTKPSKIITIQTPPQVTKPKNIPTYMVEPSVKLENVTVSVDNNKTTLDFVLSQGTYYYVEHGKNTSQLIITLGNATMEHDIPVLLENTAIKSLIFNRHKDGIEINLELLPDTQIMELQLYSQPRNQLQLVLFNNRTPVGKVTKVEAKLTLQQQADVKYQKATDLIAQNNNSAAIEELRSIIKMQPENYKAYETLLSLLIRTNQLDSAMLLLNNAVVKFPNSIPFIQTLAEILAQKGNDARALQLLLRSPPDIVVNPDYYALIASIYQHQNKNLQAAQIYDQLLKLYPNKAIWWTGLAISLESAGQKNAAQEAYQRAYSIGGLPPELSTFVANKVQK